MSRPHKSKILSSFLATTLGIIGIHRFYLAGKRDPWGWLHLMSVPVALLISQLFINLPGFVSLAPLSLSFLASLLESIVLGLTSDEKWDAKYNSESGQKTESTWILAVILVFTVGLGAISLIAALARGFDLLYTGGAYG